MRCLYIDARDPVLNVYDMDSDQPIPVGETVDFGLDTYNTMRGAWEVLSHERSIDTRGDSFLRVNVIRA